MTKDEVLQLERAKSKLEEGYTGAIKGTPIMLRSSMAIAYARGIRDVINMLGAEGYDIVKRPPAVTTETPQEAT